MISTQQQQLLAQWEAAKTALENAKSFEMDMRKAVTAAFFPNPKDGTQRVELANGYALKLVAKTNYTFPDKKAMHDALCAIEATGNEGAFVAERLVTFDPRLSVAEYKGLSEVYRKIIDKALVTKPASPVLEIEAPKEAKR